MRRRPAAATLAGVVLAACLEPGPFGDPQNVLVGAGDIASCQSAGDEATADLLDRIAGTVFTAGDNAYVDASDAEFRLCYDPSWGRHKGRTRPAAGNHEYDTDGAAAYFRYFGAAAGDTTRGYYSYELAGWHIVVLNTAIDVSGGSPQEQWLRADLAAHPTLCTAAYFHHPLFSSGDFGVDWVKPLWQALYDAGAEVVIAGHDHLYERFAPQTPDGVLDTARGIRQFTVGTGGYGLWAAGPPIANSEVLDNETYGVLKLTLRATGYDWEFVPVRGRSFTDRGSGTCH